MHHVFIMNIESSKWVSPLKHTRLCHSSMGL